MTDEGEVVKEAGILHTAETIANIRRRMQHLEALESPGEAEREELVQLDRVIQDFRNLLLRLKPKSE